MAAWENKLEKDRAAGVMVSDGKIVLIHRVREGMEYWVLPGGGIEKGESPDAALDRELLEELGISVNRKELMFSLDEAGRKIFQYYVKDYSGSPALGSELQKGTDSNRYSLAFVSPDELGGINLVPAGMSARIKEYLKSTNLHE